jgi:hypothetical protein
MLQPQSTRRDNYSRRDQFISTGFLFNIPWRNLMTNTSNSTQTVAYFNAHTEGLGYLDSLVRVTPKPGQDFEAFWSANFCILEGNPQKPEKLFVSLTVPSEKALDDLLPFVADINSETTKVFVGLRLAKFRGKPFTFAADSQTPGKLGINYSARLISVLYLKVGDSVIKLKRDEQEATTDFGVTASSVAQRNTQAPNATINTTQAELPYVVQLSKEGISAEEFEAAKTRLKEAGYKWQAELKVWALPDVKLEKNDPHFIDKMALLKKAGYRWNKDEFCWRLASSQPQQNRSHSGYRSNTQPYNQQRTYQQH